MATAGRAQDVSAGPVAVSRKLVYGMWLYDPAMPDSYPDRVWAWPAPYRDSALNYFVDLAMGERPVVTQA